MTTPDTDPKPWPLVPRDRLRFLADGTGVHVADACLITGSRDWEDGHLPVHDRERINHNHRVIRDAIVELLPPDTLIITGGAWGVDAIADQEAKRLHYPTVLVPYCGHWGKAGGPLRNGIMVALLCGLRTRQGTRIRVIACHDIHPDDLRKGSGTRDCWSQALAADVPHFYRAR